MKNKEAGKAKSKQRKRHKSRETEKQRSIQAKKQQKQKAEKQKHKQTNKEAQKQNGRTAERGQGFKKQSGGSKNKGPVYFDKISCTCAAQPCTCAAQHYLYNNRAKNNRERDIYIYESCHPDQPVELYFKYCPAPLAKKILGYRANYLINYISFKPIKYISQKYS